jgi:hypothetical protein
MGNNNIKLAIAAGVALTVLGCAHMSGPKNPMTFFVTSTGSGKGADLGGLSGADQHCQSLAQSVEAGGNRVWRAYLSTTGAGSVNARDRIGRGPWQNAKGEVIASDINELHGNNRLTKQTALTEKGGIVNGRGDKPNMHDILTGSSNDGRALPGANDTTCNNWTSSTTGSAMVGHHDRMGLDESAAAKSWNSSHPSKGCSQDALRSTGGNAFFYCFATN